MLVRSSLLFVVSYVDEGAFVGPFGLPLDPGPLVASGLGYPLGSFPSVRLGIDFSTPRLLLRLAYPLGLARLR